MSGDFDFDFNADPSPARPKSGRREPDADPPARRPTPKPAPAPEPADEEPADDFAFDTAAPKSKIRPGPRRDEPDEEPDEAPPPPRPAPRTQKVRRSEPDVPPPEEPAGDFAFISPVSEPPKSKVRPAPRREDPEDEPPPRPAPRTQKAARPAPAAGPVGPPSPTNDFAFDAPAPAAPKAKAKPTPPPEPVEDPQDEAPPPPRKERPRPTPPARPAQEVSPAADFAFDVPAPTGPKSKARPAPRREEPEEAPDDEPPPPRPVPRKGRLEPRGQTPPAPVAGPSSDFSFDTEPAAPARDDRDEEDDHPPPPRARRGRVEEDERPSSSKSRYGAKAKKEKGPKSPLLYMGFGAGGVAIIAGIVITVLLMKKDPPVEVAKDKDKTKTVAPVVTPAEKKKEPEPGADFMTAEVRERVKRSTVYIRCVFNSGRAGTGTGFVEKTSKYVVTNAHVVGLKVGSERNKRNRPKDMDGPPDKDVGEPKDKPAPKGKGGPKGKAEMPDDGDADDKGPRVIDLVFNSGEGDKEQHIPGELLAYDVERDLAVIRPNRVAGENTLVVDGLVIPKQTKVTELQRLFVFGYPLGESLGKEITITDTTVSSLRKQDGKLRQIQVKGGMTNGNSGGPIVDGRGNVLGVAVSKIRGEEINFAIPGEVVLEFFRDEEVK